MKPKNDHQVIELSGDNFTIADLHRLVIDPKTKISITAGARKRVAGSFTFVKEILDSRQPEVIYGINTGFGPMANYILAPGQLLELQNNLILSHAVGQGMCLKNDFILAAMAVRLNTLAKGYSGVSEELLERLRLFINSRIIPTVPEHGAVGTSGDLVQLAHIALAILGQGTVSFKGQTQKTTVVHKAHGIKPYKLKPKEGLALINGTSMMSGIAALVCYQSRNLLSLGLRNSCLALELVQAYDDSYSARLHALRPHPGQVRIAALLRQILATSKLVRNRKVLRKNANFGETVNRIDEAVQEIYSMRCVAQVLGPIYETMAKAWEATEVEINSVTDNPIVDVKQRKFLHGGNFHGDIIASNMDQLKAALVKLTMLSERRLNFFLHDKINKAFPPFLNLATPGLTLGLQGLQFVATSTTAHSQTLAYPMHLHSIPTNGDNQDIVSMGTDAAILADKVANNAFIVLAIEAAALCQAVDFLNVKSRLSRPSRQLYDFVRQTLPKIIEDRHFQPELESLIGKIKTWPELSLFEKF